MNISRTIATVHGGFIPITTIFRWPTRSGALDHVLVHEHMLGLALWSLGYRHDRLGD